MERLSQILLQHSLPFPVAAVSVARNIGPNAKHEVHSAMVMDDSTLVLSRVLLSFSAYSLLPQRRFAYLSKIPINVVLSFLLLFFSLIFMTSFDIFFNSLFLPSHDYE